MTAPYFTDGLVSLYLADCLDFTDWLAADVLVTDPPYGRGWRQGAGGTGHTGRRHRGKHAHAGIAGDADTTVRDEALELRGDRCGIVFGDPLVDRPARARQALGYRKPPDGGNKGTFGGFLRDLELIYLTGPWKGGLNGRTSVLTTGSHLVGGTYGTAARYGHPHAKPVDVMEVLISACPPGVIADPFAGSGSTLVAARNLGRRAVGVELDERYAEKAARRLSQATLFGGAA